MTPESAPVKEPRMATLVVIVLIVCVVASAFSLGMVLALAMCMDRDPGRDGDNPDDSQEVNRP